MASVTPLHKHYLTQSTQHLKISATLEINELVAQRLHQGKSVIHMGFGEGTFPLPKDVLTAHMEASKDTRYLPVAGLFKLRQNVAQFQSQRLGTVIDPKQVVIAPGSKPLLFALFDLLRGDVLLPRPSWVSYEPQVRHAGKQLYWVETSEYDRHDITASSLQSTYDEAVAAGGDPRIMLINSPSNPTGRTFSNDTLDMIADFCGKHEISLISDEIYSDISFTGISPVSVGAGRLNSSQIIVTGGLSKTYSAGGWRVGFAILPQTSFGTGVQQALLAYASECWSAAAAPAQEAAAVAFTRNAVMDLYRERVALLHRYCTTRLHHVLEACGLDVPVPQGAFYLYPSFQPFAKPLQSLGIYTSVQLSRWLLEEFGIAALPGSVFGEEDYGLPGGRYRLRIATSGLYFLDPEERYSKGYDFLEQIADHQPSLLDLPLLHDAIQAIQNAVHRIKTAVA